MLVHEVENLCGIFHRIECAGSERCPHLFGHVTGGNFVTQLFDCFRGWPDPDEASVDHGAGELRILGQKSVTGVNCIRTRPACDGEKFVNDEVRLCTRRAFERIRFVGEFDVSGIPVLIGVHGHRPDSAVLRCTDDADGDFATVGDEDLGNSGHSCLAYCGFRLTHWPSSTKRVLLLVFCLQQH